MLEAKNRIGGRVWDDKTFKGIIVGKGAQIVNGCINNPIALMCEQVGCTFEDDTLQITSLVYIDPCKCTSLFWIHFTRTFVFHLRIWSEGVLIVGLLGSLGMFI